MNQPSSPTSTPTSNDGPAAGAEGSQVVRFAVVQLEYQPAFKNLLFEPLLPKDSETSSLLPPKMHAAPRELQTKYNELRRRIRDVYAKVHQRKIEAILEACKKWKVNLVVFPEYSIPPELLSSIARNAGDMVVVAGSHYVDYEALSRGIYESLDGQSHEELEDHSVSPVLHAGRAVQFVPKIHAAKPEAGTMKSGNDWERVELDDTRIPGPMGVLICLDFLARQSERHFENIAGPLSRCRFIAAPACTEPHSLEEFRAQAFVETNRSKSFRPVLFANDGRHGGTTIFVNEKKSADLTLFPEHAGRLEANEEGLIIADVDMTLGPRSESTPHEWTPNIHAVVAASFVYGGIEKDYVHWLDGVRTRLDTPNKSRFAKLKDVVSFVREHMPPIPKKESARQRRLLRLMQEIDIAPRFDDIDKWTTELVFPENILPMSAIWAAMARGAAKEVERWVPQVGDFGVVRDRLREPWDKLERGMNEWAEATRHGAVDIVNEVAGEFVPRDPKAQMPIVDVYEGDIDESFEEDKKEASRLYEEGRFADARVIYRQMLARAEKMLEQALPKEVPERWKPRNWVATFRLNVALSSVNLQEIVEAREFLATISTDDLDAVGRLFFAEAMALVGQLERARAVLPNRGDLPKKQHRKYDEVVQSLDLLDGRLPSGELVSDMVHLRAAPILLEKGDRLRVAESCLGIVERHAKDALIVSLAAQFLTEALRRTIIEMPSREGEIPVGQRGKIIEALERHFADFQRDKLPEPVRPSDRRVEAVFRTMMGDTDWMVDKGGGLAEHEKTFEKPDDPRDVAFRLAEEGRLDEALRLLPNDHPWGSRLDRIGLLMGKRNAQALEEALALANEFPARATIDGQTAELLHRNGRIKEALDYARRAFEQLPSIGYRLHYVDLLHINGAAQVAWDLLKGFEADKRPRVMLARGIVAEKLGLMTEAEAAWRGYVERRPKDGLARVHFADLLFVQHKPEEAAVVAWSVFREQGDTLELDALFACGRLQRLSGALNTEQEQRIKEIAAKVHARFPGEPKAEGMRLHLLTMLGEIPADVPRIEFERLGEDQGFYKFEGEEGEKAVIDIFTQKRQLADLAFQLQRQGAIPVATGCAFGGARLPLFVIRILERSPYQAGLLCPPVSLVDKLPSMQLNGATLLMSDLELLLLEALDLIPALRTALGERGRVTLFEDARDRIVDDVVQLRISSRPDELEKKAALLRKAERIPVLEADPNAPAADMDAAAVRRANAVLVGEPRKGRVDDGLERIPSRSFLHFLHDRGDLDAEQYKSILAYYADTAEPPVPLSDPLSKLLVLPRFFLERLHDIDALDRVMMNLRSVLRLEPSALLHWRNERDELVNEIEAHKLADKVHARLAENWIDVITESPVADLPKLREPSDGAEELVLEPLRQMLAYRNVILENPEWWRLTAEFFGSAHLGERETMRQFVWEGPEQYLRLVQRVRQAATRDLTFPMLVRLLIHDEKAADAVHLKLAELGFPDALGARELLRLEKRYGGLEKSEPKRILEHQEWMAREPDQLGADLAQMRLAQTYAATIFESFFMPDRTSLDRENLIDALLRRQEDIGKQRATTMLDQCFTFLIARTLDQWKKLWKEEDEHLVSDETSPIVALWKAVAAWSSTGWARRAAHHRAVRQGWRQMHRRPGGPPRVIAETLYLTHPEAIESGAEITLVSPDVEAPIILSSLWKEVPSGIAEYRPLFEFGTKTLLQNADSLGNARELRYRLVSPDRTRLREVRIPIEAIFLRLPLPEDRARVAAHLRRVQGPYDGIAYRRVERIENAPDDIQALRNYADHAAGALFRLVQDDPSYLCIWPQSHGVNASPQNKFRDLLRTLSELFDPFENFDNDADLSVLLHHRVYEGFWKQRDDRNNLLAMASEIPGILPAILIPGRLAKQVYEDHVRIAFDRLDRADEHPIARIAGDVMFLRVAAAHWPYVKLPEGEIDLRDILPARLLRLLEKVAAPPAPDTLAAAEPALLRVCGDVMQRLTVGISLSVKYALWLIYRLFQWLCLQLQAISPDARIHGIRELVRYAPPPRDGQDLLDPTSLSRDRFDHRLGTLLHAFGVMEDLVHVLEEQSTAEGENLASTTTATKISVSSSEFEDKLLDIAREPYLGPNRTSLLEWHGPGNVPDLALQALLRLSPQRLADMRPESRIHRFKQLPDNPDEENEEDGRGRVPFAHLVLTSAASIASSLTPDERRFLEEKLRGMVDGPVAREWKWLTFVALFEAGADHLEAESRELVEQHLKHNMAPMILGTFVMGLAQRDVLRVEPFLADVEPLAAAEGADVVNLVASTLGRLRVHGSSAAQTLARTMLLQLAARAPFREDDRMMQLIGFLGLRKATS